MIIPFTHRFIIRLFCVIYLTGACETGVAGVCTSRVSGVGTEAGTGAEAGTKLDKRVKGDAGRHSVRFMAGR